MYSGLLSIPLFIMVGFIGLIAYSLNPNLEPNNALTYVIHDYLPPGIRGFVIAGMLSVIMSSAAGFLNAAAVSFVNDVVKPLRQKPLREAALFWLARVSTILVGVIAILIALMINNILDILLYAYNFWAPIILVPLVAVIFTVPVSKQDFYIGALFGSIATFIWANILLSPGGITSVVIGVLANLCAFSISCLNSSTRITKPQNL